MSDNLIYIAVIGTREPTEAIEIECRKQVRDFMRRGFGIITGAAVGIDQIAMGEANMIDPERVFAVLPWKSYENRVIHKGNKVLVYDPSLHEEWTKSVYKYHPKAMFLKQGPFKLHARNYGIVSNSVAVLAFPSNKAGGGGTGQGIRIAEGMGKRLKVVKPC